MTTNFEKAELAGNNAIIWVLVCEKSSKQTKSPVPEKSMSHLGPVKNVSQLVITMSLTCVVNTRRLNTVVKVPCANPVAWI